MLKIYNTLTKTAEEFKPIHDGEVLFYHCGPTVYWTQHIGNMRAMTMADLVRRTLMYLDYDVRFVRNYTDVGHLTSDGDTGEDKMEKGAKREGLTPDQIADKYIDIFEADITALNILQPDEKPRATKYVQQMISMVQALLDKGFAYTTPAAVYFDVSKAKDYTRLSGQKLEENLGGAGHGGVDDSDNKRNPADFALWFFKTGVHASALQTWPSPFDSPAVENGEGFPGWHIECSAMSKAELGDTIDIHMGGVEHIPVHHTNEIAQSESANGAEFAHYWLHNEHLNVDNAKMAKSEGTSYSLADITAKGYDPLVLRYFFLQAHYRSKQNFTWEALDAGQTALGRLRAKVAELFQNLPGEEVDLPEANAEFTEKFVAAISDDFNIPQALAVTWEAINSDLSVAEKLSTVLDFDEVLGLRLESGAEDPREAEVPAKAQELLDQRAKAREEKNWQLSDELRDRLLEEFELVVEDGAEGQKVRAA